MKTLIIQGSSRSKGNTSKIVEILSKELSAEVLDLKTLSIGEYSYENKHIKDDFLPTIRKVVTYDTIIFATPVYWYSMSGIMKTFFDRITDCLTIEKDTGRKLRGKNMAAIACGSDDIITEGFFIPFKNSAEYLGMNYLGDFHSWVYGDALNEEMLNGLAAFIQTIKNC